MVSGYTDDPELYARYPIKRFNRMQDLKRYDTDAMLPQIHAVEFLGEPQYGGGKPVAPQEVWQKLAPYQPSRLATTVTLSEERTGLPRDPDDREFKFAPRDAKLAFALPQWREAPLHVFRIDADETHDVDHAAENVKLVIEDRIAVVGVYIATKDRRLRAAMEANALDLIRHEHETEYDPGNDEDDLMRFRSHLKN